MKRTIVNPVIKDVATFIKTAKDSGVSELEIQLMPGGGNTMHYHKSYSETFIAVEYEVGLKLGKEEVKILKPGESYTVKPMQLHCFFNPTQQQISFLIRIEPGHEGFENSLRILYGLAADGLTNKKSIPKNLTHTALILKMSDMNAPGLLTWLYPVFEWIAARPNSKIEERRLLEHYC
jgi:mannose-6-phosphate isomerase-like protein (cupin superfamily)